MIKCPGCGAEIEFNPSLQEVTCNYCNNIFSIEELKSYNLTNAKSAEHDYDTYSGETYRCSQCGATLMTFDDTLITFCSYCGSQAMLKDKITEVVSPDFIIPFSKTKEECIKSYKEKVNKFIFAPNYLKNDMQVEKFRGIYMPYAVFNLTKKGIVSNNGEKYNGRIGDYIFYDQYQIDSAVDVSYEGLSFDLVSKFYDNFSTSIPFNFYNAVPFNINYLHGFYADSCDVKDYHYKSIAKKIVEPDITSKLRASGHFSSYNVPFPKIDLDCECKTGMFPMYFLATRDKKGENVHYAAVNGQTGEVACDLPIDFTKYIFISLIVALLIFLVINNFLVLTPVKLSIFAVVMGIANSILSYIQAGKIDERTNHTSDIGYLSEKGIDYNDANFENYGVTTEYNKLLHDYSSVKELAIMWLIFSCIGFFGVLKGFLLTFLVLGVFMLPLVILEIVKCYRMSNVSKRKTKAKYFKYIYKEIIGITISLIAILSMQANDLYYYGATFLSLFLIVLSFKDLVKEHNLLTSNKLPQLDERGGNK